MASATRRPNGVYLIQFKGLDNKRKTLRCGKVTKKVAGDIKLRVEHILNSALSGFPLDSETSAWIASISDTLADRLYRAKLIDRRQKSESVTIAKFIEWYVASKPEARPRSIINYRQAGKKLTQFMGVDCLMSSVDTKRADEFVADLKSKHAEATYNRLIKFCKNFWKTAMRAKWAVNNPFADHKAGSMANSDRLYFVPREVIDRIIEECPNAEWRLIVALARYGGLRCPSDFEKLKWSDIDWERDRFTVHPTKKKASRVVPIFPELKPFLNDSFELAEEGAVYVCPRFQDGKTNLRTTFIRIVRRAGYTPWERPFQNLRASRETELCNEYPIHVAAEWIGNSAIVAAKHYLSVTEANFERATQKAKQNEAEPKGNKKNLENEPIEMFGDITSRSLSFCSVPSGPVHPTGIAPLRLSPENQYGENQSDVESDVNLAKLIAAWPALPDAVRGRIMGMVEGGEQLT